MNDKKMDLLINTGFVIFLCSIFAYLPCLGQSYDQLTGQTVHQDGTICTFN